jgi:hypothetical protein
VEARGTAAGIKSAWRSHARQRIETRREVHPAGIQLSAPSALAVEAFILALLVGLIGGLFPRSKPRMSIVAYIYGKWRAARRDQPACPRT